MLVPSRSISTALVDPHMRPSGSLNQLSMVRYGSGCEFGAWAKTSPAENIAVVTANRSRVDMALLSTGHLTSLRRQTGRSVEKSGTGFCLPFLLMYTRLE